MCAFARSDRFGNPSILKLLKPVVNKKTGDVMPIFRGHVEIGNCLYRVDVSTSQKAGREGMWCKVTKMVKRQQGGFGSFGGGFGQGQRGGL
jgi:hypothetical protein